MAKDGRYEIADLGSQAAEIDKASPLHDCNGCEADLAKKAGAEVAVIGVVDKLSDSLLSIRIFVRDVASGELKKGASAEVRGNTDELWLRGVRWLWKNKISIEQE